MNDKILGFKLSVPEGHKIVSIPMDDDLKEYFGLNEEQQKHHFRKYLQRYAGGEKDLDIMESELWKFAFDGIPKEVKAKCPKCNGTAKDENDSLCLPYTLTLEMNYSLAGKEFVEIVERNKSLIGNDDEVKRLTQEFFKSFILIEGYLAFDLHRITMYTLNAGFGTLSKIFEENKPLKNLKIINQSIDNLNREELEYQTIRLNKDCYHIPPQKKFFEDRERYYKNEVFIKSQKKARKQQKQELPSKEDQLRELGFFELIKVTQINEQKLVEHLKEMTVPYQIAYFNYLGLFAYMQKNLSLSKYVINKKISEILKINERAVKGNWSVLNPQSTEDRERYTAHKYKDEVEKHYQTLK